MPAPHPDHKLVARSDTCARSTVRAGGAVVGADTFTLVAGACAVESPEQLAAACDAAVAAGATMLRGDLFKHRTSPYAFQGLGADGVALVANERARHGLPWVIEVLHPDDLETVDAVADVVRVGARNMQNFELLKACARSGKPVMLKRGLSATVDEWLLAAEYVAASGSLDVILCERGIRTFEPSTRNTLDLSAVPVVRERSHLPVVVDPSHGTGARSLVEPMALAAVAAGADGVMLDVHADPANARCDGPQALLPGDAAALGAKLRGLARWMGRAVDEPARTTAAFREDGWQICESGCSVPA
ncbi:MAG TPA: 3-deoxy-7-phosphoheptulonate synthase [Acidimicrobiia bacterium]|nr:3-deoxy-7-phosphoheptulonate synthase [Acidimicrobiia bacterium]